ncbi:glycosyltransferase family 4 protein [Thioalkalicoccus limnaeus]
MLTRYGPLGASSRVRMMQYRSSLEAAGFRVEVSSFFCDEYVRQLYADGRRRPWPITLAYLGRFAALIRARRAGVVWLEKEALPFLPGGLERLFARSGAALVLDYDDAVFHRYDQHQSPLVRRLLGRKLFPLLRAARLVTAGSAYLRDYAQAAGAPRVELIPTVVDLDRYPLMPEGPDGELRIGWIGSPQTAACYLGELAAPLQRLARVRALRFVAIGAGPPPALGVPIESHPWSAATEGTLLASIHLGVMPLPDAPFERGKCGYKLIQYCASGRPVVASPVGVNAEIVTPDVGMIASGPDEWFAALKRLADDPTLRARLGSAGRRKVAEHYSLAAVAPRVVRLLGEAGRC